MKETSRKYICIHGHFYQPPRENAWLEVIERQEGAAPFHDWNERINFECYARNAAARIKDDGNTIINIINNYEHISFNFGPTLLAWMEKSDPVTYRRIQAADRDSVRRFGGHGSAMAQVYGHLIMPLANRRDKETQVRWGIADFQKRFDRKPEGMWLAETAVDLETLEVLAGNDIRFTVLAPNQAARVRRFGSAEWLPVDQDRLDTRRAYRCQLPSGRSIALFFYDGGISRDIAFNGLLNSGKALAARLMHGFDPEREEARLVHVATDGETYGHHHRFGEMALADCIELLRANPAIDLTNYGAFLEAVPPTWEVEIHERSSWSCAHGVERWRSDCGCHTGGEPGWNQSWRKPLRETLDWLRDRLIPVFEKMGSKWFADPWQARDAYIRVILDRSDRSLESFLNDQCRRKPGPGDLPEVLRLLEMQRQAMQMYTSCGWFFNEVSGIETLQILQYANRAIHFYDQLSGQDLHPEFVERLRQVPSNRHANAAEAYLRQVAPASVDLFSVGMHYAASTVFEEHPSRHTFYNYVARNEHFERLQAGQQRLTIGQTTLQSVLTRSVKHFSFAVLYLGQQNLFGNLSLDMGKAEFDQMADELRQCFRRADLAETIGTMQDHFGGGKFTIRQLFRDEQRHLLNRVMETSLQQAEASFRDIYLDNYLLMVDFRESGMPVPEAYHAAVEFVLNRDLLKVLKEGPIRPDKLQRIADEFERWNFKLSNLPLIRLLASEYLFREVRLLEHSDLPLENLRNLVFALEVLYRMGVEPDIWQSQNGYFRMVSKLREGKWVFSGPEWREQFIRLGELLRVQTGEVPLTGA